MKNSKYSGLLHNLPKLSETDRNKLDAPYTLDKLLFFIRASKLNKAPGPNGYSNEFFNFFNNLGALVRGSSRRPFAFDRRCRLGL